MQNNKKKLLFLIIVLVFISLACSSLSMANRSNFKVLVSVTLPGSSGADSHLYKPGEVYEYNAGSGGPYTVSVIPQEDYIAEMDSLREKIIIEMFRNSDLIVQFTEKLASIDKTLSSLTTHSCSGTIKDESDLMATIDMSNKGIIELNCPSN